MTRHPKLFIVQPSNYDAARPWAVVATFRSFNKTVKRYEDIGRARRHATYLNKREAKAAA